MSAASPAPQRYPRLQRLIEWLTYAYLIRFPLLTAAALVGIPYAAFFTGARSLLENLFDLDPGAIMLVTMIALLSAWSVMVTARLVLTYSNERFGVTQAEIGPLGWRHILLFGLLAAPVIAGVVYEIVKLWDYTLPSTTNLWKIAALAPGIIIAFLLLWSADLLQRRFNSPATNRKAPELAATLDDYWTPVLRNLIPAQVISGNSTFNTGNSISAGLPKYSRNRLLAIADILERE